MDDNLCGTLMSDYLFAHPSFLYGIARSLDLGGTFDAYNESLTPNEADGRAIASDWLAVGKDLQGALEATEVKAEHELF
jgi:hypothetical protein